MVSTINVGKYYYADVKLKTRFDIILDIDKVLKEIGDCHRLFSKTCFGNWFFTEDCTLQPELLHFMLLNFVGVNKDKEELIFDIVGIKLHFGPEQFCLMSGMKFGVLPRIAGTCGGSFRERVFGKIVKKTSYVCVRDLHYCFRNLLSSHTDLDVVRICLLELLHVGFIDRNECFVVDDELLQLVEDLDAWNNFPWGSYVWRPTYDSLCKDLKTRLTYCHENMKCPPKYSLRGFMFAFKIWILEVLPCSKLLYDKEIYLCLPRGIAWTKKKDFDWSVCVKFDKICREVEFSPKDIKVTPLETRRPWYQDTMRFLKGPKEDVDSLLAKFERRFDDMEGKQENRRFGNIEQLLEVLWKKAYPDYNMHNFDFTEEELEQIFAVVSDKQPVIGNVQPVITNQQPVFCNVQPVISGEQPVFSNEEPVFSKGKPVISTQELLNKADDEWTDEDMIRCLESCDDEEMIVEDVGTSRQKVTVSSAMPVRQTNFETTAREFYRRGVQNGNPVDHYLFITGFPYHLDLDFWGRLLNLSCNGWLENEHIDIWSNMVALSPRKDQRCGILPVDFHYILHDCERIYELANGTEGPCPPWWTLDRVLFPLNQSSQHWMLAELYLTSWNVRIYDSNALFDPIVPTPRMTYLYGIHNKLQQLIPLILDKIDYWSKARVGRVHNLQVNMQYLGITAPQQSDSSSCGIYVCHFIEKLAHLQSVHIQCSKEVFEVSYRQRAISKTVITEGI